MASYVLAGDLESKNEFLAKLIKEENIKSYNLFDYQETLKIPQVREIKKLLSTKAFSGAKRLFVIRDATLEAQNALLKTLEELHEDTSFIFSNEAILIPTILSRTQILNFKRRKVDVDANLSSMLENFLKGNMDLSSTFLFSEELFTQSPDLNFANLIFCLREILFKQIQEDSFEKIGLTLRLLKSLYRYLSFVENNNLNKKLLFERIIIEEISL
ncbi:MAG: hypothetical protein A2868_03190 [Candidatus Levybacteria bacterium RIFCSPHIGHO2_01_FULL_40_15b]|nr:MAG: hypothetical protein A2868_03190 [Candidatus Levybacteria bacterium RIFCSPHIGHO2_01_FULL_40_15b]